MIIVSGKYSSLWKELKGLFGPDEIFYFSRTDRSLVNVVGDILCDSELAHYNEITFLNFGAATPNNTDIADKEAFLLYNFDYPKELVTRLIEKSEALIFVINITTTAIYNRSNDSPLLEVNSEFTSPADSYGYSKLLFMQWLKSMYSYRFKCVSLVVPVLLGMYSEGNCVSNLITARSRGIVPNVAYLDESFNALVSVRVIGQVLWYCLSEKDDTFSHNEIVLLACSSGGTVRDILRLAGVDSFAVVEYRFPPKKIDLASIFNIMPHYRCDLIEEMRHYVKCRNHNR